MIDFSTLKELVIDGIKLVELFINNVLVWASGLPSAYQQVKWIKADKGVVAYINLGLKFDTAGTANIQAFFEDVTQNYTYLFGAAENGGKHRFMISAPYPESHASGYFTYEGAYRVSQISIYNGANQLTLKVENGKGYLQNDTYGIVKNGDADTYTMTSDLHLLGQMYNGSVRVGEGVRKVGTFKYYDKNNTLVCSLIPCYRKSDNVVGMYDVVRGIFLTNAGTGSFTAGPRVGVFTNLVPTSTEADGVSIYNGGLGYKQGWRVRSGGTEAENTYSTITGYIPAKAGDCIRVGGVIRSFVDGGVGNAINVYTSLSSEAIGQIVGNSASGYGIFIADGSHYGQGSQKVVQKDDYWQWTIPPNAGINYIRVTGFTRNDNQPIHSELIVTINEEIEL